MSNNKKVWGCLCFLLYFGLFWVQVSGAVVDKLWITQVQIAGQESASDEFVEIYNPEDYAVSLDGWEIKKETAAGKEYEIWSGGGGEVPPRGRFLIVPARRCGPNQDADCYTGALPAEGYYTKNVYLSEDSSLVLYDGASETVDRIGWGAASGAAAENPAPGEHLEKDVASGLIRIVGADVPDVGSDSDSSVAAVPDADSEGTNTDDPDGTASGGDSGTSSQPAAVGKMIVSEFLPNPAGSDSEMEFVEIYNAGTSAVDLAHWSLSDQAGAIGTYIFPSGSVIGAGKHRAFFSSQTRLPLNNSGDGVVLKDASNQVISRTPICGAAGEDIAFALGTDGNWSWTSLPTPAGKNVIREIETLADNKAADGSAVAASAEADDNTQELAAALYDFSDEVVISEIFPNPSGADNREGNWEWVEFYNAGSRAVDLRGWCLDDYLEKGSKLFCFERETILAAGNFLLVQGDMSQLVLNNAAEEVNLLWPDGSVADSVSYAKAKEGYAYSLAAEGIWSWTKNPTPRAKNGKADSALGLIASAFLPAGSRTATGEGGSSEADAEDWEAGEVAGASAIDLGAYASVSIAAARQLPRSSRVVLEGIVATTPGSLGEGIFYIVDPDHPAGIQVLVADDPSGAVAGLLLGDKVAVYGTLSAVGGEDRLLLDACALSSADHLLPVSVLDLEQLESALGSLVRTEGTIQDVSAQLFYLEMDQGKIKVYAEPGTGLSFADYASGNRIAVTGILSRTSESYRLLPRFASDLHFLEKENDGIMAADKSAVPAATTDSLLPVRMFFFLSFLILLDWSRLRMKSRGKSR